MILFLKLPNQPKNNIQTSWMPFWWDNLWRKEFWKLPSIVRHLSAIQPMKAPQNDYHQLHAIHQTLKIHNALFWPLHTEKENSMKISISNNKQSSYSRSTGKTDCNHASLWIDANLFAHSLSCLSDKFCAWKLLWFWKALPNSSRGYFNFSIKAIFQCLYSPTYLFSILLTNCIYF